jgi:hypothetical protein
VKHRLGWSLLGVGFVAGIILGGVLLAVPVEYARGFVHEHQLQKTAAVARFRYLYHRECVETHANVAGVNCVQVSGCGKEVSMGVRRIALERSSFGAVWIAEALASGVTCTDSAQYR